jgi:hypothetical protein
VGVDRALRSAREGSDFPQLGAFRTHLARKLFQRR